MAVMDVLSLRLKKKKTCYRFRTLLSLGRFLEWCRCCYKFSAKTILSCWMCQISKLFQIPRIFLVSLTLTGTISDKGFCQARLLEQCASRERFRLAVRLWCIGCIVLIVGQVLVVGVCSPPSWMFKRGTLLWLASLKKAPLRQILTQVRICFRSFSCLGDICLRTISRRRQNINLTYLQLS